MTTNTYYSEAADGHILGQSATYATARSTSTASDDTSTVNSVGQNFGGGQYFVFRGFLSFDTSAIPDDATVDSATLGVCADADSSVTDFNVQIYRYAWAETIAANREANFDGAYGGSATLEGTLRNTASGWTSGTFYTLAVDAAGINVSGDTKYTICSSRDIGSNTPGGSEFVNFRSGDYASTTSDPYLEVTYTEAATGQPVTVRAFAVPFARPAGFGGVRITG
jgi:hypothetical protein